MQDSTSGSRHDRERDDASSFYGMQRGGDQGRGSSDMLVGQRPAYGGTAGYNRNSYFHVGREAPVKGVDQEQDDFMGSRRDLGAAPGAGMQGGPDDEEAGWNVFADFNNFGPRYSGVLPKQDTGYVVFCATIPDVGAYVDEPSGTSHSRPSPRKPPRRSTTHLT